MMEDVKKKAEKMKERRTQFIYRLYDLADGDVRKWVDALHIARELGFDEATIDTILVYFRMKGFLETEGFGRFFYNVRITPVGVDYIEEAVRE
jgi:hypothetical protein